MTELFEKYYSKSLSENERIEFENKIESNQEIAQDYEAFVMMMEHLEVKDDVQSALDVLNDVHGGRDDKHSVKDETPKSKVRYLRYLIAASLLIPLLGLVYLWNSSNTISDPKEIYATNFEPAPISLATKGGNLEATLSQINADYKARKYTDVISGINQLNIDSLAENKIYFMLGSSYLTQDSFAEAREALKPMESSAQFRNDFNWYMAMSYLGEGNANSAKTFLLKIPTDSNYFVRAKKILGQIKE